MKLYRITIVEELNTENEQEIFILADGVPNYKKILKRVNMIEYCGHEMSNDDYKEFVVKLGNYKKYNIESVDEIDYLKF